MNQEMHSAADQVTYRGRWVSRKNFRVFVYGHGNKKKIVNTHEAYLEAIGSGDWFSSEDEVIPKPKAARKAKNGADG